jgi:hypothetical protein
VSEGEADLRAVLEMLDPLDREAPPPCADPRPAHRDEISSRLMRYRAPNGQDWADIIDMVTKYPGARQRVVRLVAEIDAADRR